MLLTTFILHTLQLIPRTRYSILHASYPILHTPYHIIHTPYCILHTPRCILHLIKGVPRSRGSGHCVWRSSARPHRFAALRLQNDHVFLQSGIRDLRNGVLLIYVIPYHTLSYCIVLHNVLA